MSAVVVQLAVGGGEQGVQWPPLFVFTHEPFEQCRRSVRLHGGEGQRHVQAGGVFGG